MSNYPEPSILISLREYNDLKEYVNFKESQTVDSRTADIQLALNIIADHFFTNKDEHRGQEINLIKALKRHNLNMSYKGPCGNPHGQLHIERFI